MDPKTTTPAAEEQRRKELYDRAFRRWWDADYSIEGLKTKMVPWENGTEISLYDYWLNGTRRVEVVKFAGREWTTFHLPLHDLQGNNSEKSEWSADRVGAFYAEIFQRESEGEQRFNIARQAKRNLPGPPFHGVVFPDNEFVSSGTTIRPSYTDAIFAGRCELRASSTANDLDFGRALFLDQVMLANHAFQGEAKFDGAVFFGPLHGSRSTFARVCSLKGARLEYTAFNGARFEQNLFLDNAIVDGPAEFDGGLAGSFWLRGTDFRHSATFGGREFRNFLVLTDTMFRGPAFFEDCIFGEAVSGSPTFFDVVTFRCKSGAEFGAHLHFRDARFLSTVDFGGRQFLRPVGFVGCRFDGAPMFFGTKLHSSMSFAGSQFTATLGQLPDLGKKFDQLFISQPTAADAERTHQLIAPFALYPRLASWAFHWVPFAEWLPPFAPVRNERDAATKLLEDSYRTLRHLCEGDSELSGRFYALEMDSRRNRRDVSIVERWLLFLFALSSGYGRYIGKALAVLLSAISGVTLLVWLGLDRLVWPIIPPNLGEVFGFVWRLFLLPAPFSGPEEARVYWAATFIREWPVGYRLLSGVCALATTGIVGVILVTLRRRFALK